jgi:hypothetical protein
MKPSSLARGGVTGVLCTLIIASLLFLGLSQSFATSAQPAPQATPAIPAIPAQSSSPGAITQLIAPQAAPAQTVQGATTQPPSPQRMDAWRAAISRTPFPKEGCFTSSYPSREWQQVPCTIPPPHNLVPAEGPSSSTVGKRNDFSAHLSPGSISSVIGSFDSVLNVMSEDDSQNGQNAFSLQINTKPFSTPACSAPCQGWQQFLYVQGAGVFIEYWLLNYGPNCPPVAWRSFQGHCVGDTAPTPVPPQAITALSQLSLWGQVSGGMDSVILWVGNQPYARASSDAVLNLQGNWTDAEFNVFGEINGSQANFNIGSTVSVRTTVNSAPSVTPNTISCVKEGFTGETNNLYLVSPCSTLPAESAIVFTERLMGPAPSGNPLNASTSAFDVFASVYNNQQHFMYRDTNGNIQDVWYDGSGGWQLQQLTGTSPTLGNEPVVTNGPGAVGNIFVSVYGNQQHVMYRDANDNVQDAWYDGNHWNLQQLTETLPVVHREPVVAHGPAALGDVFVSVYGNQQHVMYRDTQNNLQDVWYDGRQWQLQQLTGVSQNEPVVGHGPAALGDVFVSVYGGQQHVIYRDNANNNVQDVWYDGNQWSLQRLTGTSKTIPTETLIDNAGPPPAGNVFVSIYNNQQHVTYRDKSNNIQDVWYDGGWNLQQISQPPATVKSEYVVTNGGPAASGNVFVSTYSDQLHFTYPDSQSNIQDLWYNGSGWHLQQLAGN